uniref:hypothetical protein n=1 Tax=Mycobacterium sp. HUMS_1102779 TaxID=3383487 RepID=UPI00389B2BBF
MKRILAAAALLLSAYGFGAFDPASAHAEPGCQPFGGPGCCQFLGQNYTVYYPCTQYQPWLPYGTANNPPLGGSVAGDCSLPINAHNIGCS